MGKNIFKGIMQSFWNCTKIYQSIYLNFPLETIDHLGG